MKRWFCCALSVLAISVAASQGAGNAKQLNANMRAIYDALWDYAYNNSGALPKPAGIRGLNLLITDEYLLTVPTYLDPRRPQKLPPVRRYNTYTELQEEFCGYVYLGNGESLRVKPPVPVLFTKPGGGLPVMVLYSDGKIRQLPGEFSTIQKVKEFLKR